MADQTLASSPSSSLVVRDSHNLDRRIVFDIRDGRVIAPNLVRGGVVGESGTLVEVIHEVELSQEVVEQAVGRDDAEAAKHFVQRVERQLNVICSLDHINIARFQGWTMMLEDETWLRARVTYASCEGGKVMDYLSANVNADRQKLILGVSRGLSYLHSKDIVHGNLNPGNVRIDCGANDTHPIPRISGFGSSYAMTDVTPVRLIVEGACSVPLRYVAPEVLAGRGVPCDQKGDIWSLGCTSSQMLLGRRPYESIRNDFHIPFAAARHVAPYTWDSSDPYHQALQRCLIHDPSQRAAASDVVERLELVIALSEIRRQLLEVEERNLTGRIQIVGDIFQDGSGVRSRGICGGEDVCVRYSNGISPSDGNEILNGQILHIKRHIRIWGRLVHRNIEAFRGWALSVEGRKLHVGFISSWRESVAVRRYLRQNPSADRRELVHGVAQGLLYLHSEGVVHANIHPDNVMIGNEGDSYLRGFDFSYDHRSEEPLYGYRGGLQLRFTPPELLNRPTPIPTESSDIWAFGCISGEILTGRPPYAGLSDTEVMTNPVASPVAPYHLNDVDPFEGAIPGCFLPRDQRPRIKDIIGTWSQHLSPPIHAPAPPNNDDPTKSYVAGSSRESRRSSKGSGCLTCRLRKKRCPRFTDSTDPCSECERLRLQCLRHGFTWPNEEKLAEARQKIREWTAPKRPRSHGLVGYFPSLHSLISAIVGMLNLSEIFLDASLGSMSQGGVMGSGVGPSGGQGDTGPAHPLPDELFMGFASEQIPHLENVQLPPVIPGVDESDNAGEALCWPAFSL